LQNRYKGQLNWKNDSLDEIREFVLSLINSDVVANVDVPEKVRNWAEKRDAVRVQPERAVKKRKV